jgi:integrase
VHNERLAIQCEHIDDSHAAKLQKKGLAKKTVRNVLNLLNRFFADAVKNGYVRHSPMEGVDKLSRKKKGRALTPKEIQALLANTEDEQTRLIPLRAFYQVCEDGNFGAAVGRPGLET